MHRCRRLFQRQKARGAEDLSEYLEAYRAAKNMTQTTIWRAKESKWAKLCGMVDADPWCKAYTVVMVRIRGRGPRKITPVEQTRRILVHLFAAGQQEDRRPQFPSLGGV